MLSVELLPAAHGDSIWIEYGTPARRHRVLIDGGPAHSYQAGLRRRLGALPERERTLDLMVVTHIDADHIDGALILLQERKALKLNVLDLWFNAWSQLPATPRDTYAPLQGEFLGGLIKVDRELDRAWNRPFGRRAVVVPEGGRLPEVVLGDGATLTLLGPALSDLRRLRARWASAIREFSPGDANEALRRLRERREYRPPTSAATFAAKAYGDDRTVANGSSISFLFEHDGVAILFAGDAHARTLAASLDRLTRQRGVPRLRLDAVKLPHHGSMGNVSADWLRYIDCTDWLISTNGAVFDHPDAETAALVATQHRGTVRMLCNYRAVSTERLARQGNERLARRDGSGWSTVFPAAGKRSGPAGGLRVEWNGETRARGRGAGTRSHAQKRAAAARQRTSRR